MYLELIGGKQSKLDFESVTANINSSENLKVNIDEHFKQTSLREINHVKIDENDHKLHLKSIQTIKNSIWQKINN